MDSSVSPAAKTHDGPAASPSIADDSLELIVPCYNEEESLKPFYEAIVKVRTQLRSTLSLILVDDGSNDKTMDIMRDLAEQGPHVHCISLSRNFGKEAAMYAGFCRAAKSHASYYGVIDVDLQDPPELIPKMIATIHESGCDSVAAYRFTRKGERRIRSFCASLFYKLLRRLSSIEVVEGARDFRIMNRRMFDAVVSLSERVRFTKGIFQWVGFDTRWIGYENVERERGESKWSFRALVSYALEGVISFTEAPMRTMVAVGLSMAGASALILLIMLIYALTMGTAINTLACIIFIVALFAGLQIFCLGIVGLYVAQTYTEARARPVFIIKEEH